MFLLKLPESCKKFVASDCIEFHLPRKHHDCPFGGSQYTYVHDYRKQNLCGFSAEIKYIYKRRRYRCQDCGKTFSESNSFIERYQQIPCSEIEHIIQELADPVLHHSLRIDMVFLQQRSCVTLRVPRRKTQRPSRP